MIRDNGKEFSPPEATRKEGRGLTNIRARAQLIHSDLNWRRLDTDETVFTLEKPRQKKEEVLDAAIVS